jgi:YesN/AraC family two-component response regulator
MINSSTVRCLEIVINQWIQDKKFTTPGITLTDLAIEFNTNRTYLSMYVNAYKGVNFNAWINKLRIEEAQKLLVEQFDLSIIVISELLGYSDSSSFGRQFVKIAGCTPLTWRKRNVVLI